MFAPASNRSRALNYLSVGFGCRVGLIRQGVPMTPNFALRAWAKSAFAAAAILAGGLIFSASPAMTQVPLDVSNYLIGPGDHLQISVWKNPELSAAVPVRPDGRISTPLVSEVVAAGRTPEELGHDIEDRLKKYVHRSYRNRNRRQLRRALQPAVCALSGRRHNRRPCPIRLT
jgi:hypothetical protein